MDERAGCDVSAPTFDLPQLTGTRDRAKRLIADADLPVDLSAAEVRVNAGSTLAGTDSFADELVRAILVERHAARLVVDLVGTDFSHKLVAAADRYAVTDKLVVTSGRYQD